MARHTPPFYGTRYKTLDNKKHNTLTLQCKVCNGKGQVRTMKMLGVVRFVVLGAVGEIIGGATLGAALGYPESHKSAEDRGTTVG